MYKKKVLYDNLLLMKKVLELLLKAFVIFFLILTFVFLYFSLFDKQIILNILAWMKDFVAWLWYWNYIIILVFWFIESFPLVWISVPWQTVLLMVAWFLGYQNMPLAMFCAAIWALLWNYFWYLLGVKFWDSFFEKYWKWIGITKTDIKYVKKWIEKHGWLFVIFWKFHNLFRAFVPFIAGSSKMNNKFFTVLNIIWSVFRAVVMVSLWVFFVNNAEKILDNIWKILLVIMLWLLAYIYFYKREEFMKYLEEKQKDI